MKYKDIQKQAENDCLRSTSKNYLHFDAPLTMSAKKKLLKKFSYDTYVTSFRHLPFIEFKIKLNKYGLLDAESGSKGIHEKVRTISLPSHHDSFLFKYYGRILSMCYEQFVEDTDINNIAIAYRHGKSNITGAKEVFDFLWQVGDSWIIKGDFSAFFDNLNHQILFKNANRVIKQYFNGRIPKDWQSVLKAITKYRSIQKEELKSFKQHAGRYQVEAKTLSKMMKSGKIKVGKLNKKGIPQGTSISSVLANIYMLEFDELVQKLLDNYGGFYRRYSDDFAIVVPINNCDLEEIHKLLKQIQQLCQSRVLLAIEDHKSKLLYFDAQQKIIYQAGTSKRYNFDFLGFSFTGKKVILRPKTIYKFHYKGKHAIYLLRRNVNERDIASSLNYKLMKNIYLSNRPVNKQKKIVRRLDNIHESIKHRETLKFRKKVTTMYLINKPLFQQNMLYYAKLAQEKFSENIPNATSHYQVNIEKPIVKQIGSFQRMFGKIRLNRPYRNC